MKLSKPRGKKASKNRGIGIFKALLKSFSRLKRRECFGTISEVQSSFCQLVELFNCPQMKLGAIILVWLVFLYYCTTDFSSDSFLSQNMTF